MATLTKRVQVLFSEEQWRALQRIAEQQDRSVGHLIREAVAQTYLTPTATRERQERMEMVEAMIRMNLPVDDWDAMERQATDRTYFDEVDDVDPQNNS